MIIGQTGSGKSVLTGLLIENLTAKDNTSVQILDVGSSHTNTVKALGGKVRTFSLSKPSGINPFKYVTDQHITIEDQGAGIANLDNVFVPFYTTKNQGSGIGLTLCRQIMFNHNGLIKLKNVEVE